MQSPRSCRRQTTRIRTPRLQPVGRLLTDRRSGPRYRLSLGTDADCPAAQSLDRSLAHDTRLGDFRNLSRGWCVDDALGVIERVDGGGAASLPY